MRLPPSLRPARRRDRRARQAEDRVVHRAIRVDCPLGIRYGETTAWSHIPGFSGKQDVLGRVARVRGSARGTPRRVLGGRSGLVYGAALRSVHGANRRLTSWLRPLYHRLSRWGIPADFSIRSSARGSCRRRRKRAASLSLYRETDDRQAAFRGTVGDPAPIPPVRGRQQTSPGFVTGPDRSVGGSLSAFHPTGTDER